MTSWHGSQIDDGVRSKRVLQQGLGKDQRGTDNS
jgi:hypothetical protein